MIDKILLAPYYIALKCRHFLYDKGIRKSVKAEVPSICIGNITVGGTGKTPHTELVLRILLSSEAAEDRHVAVLSRGYKRESKGFQQVMTDSSPALSGDEPLQIKKKFPEVTVAVDADRVEGCRFLCHPEALLTSKKGRRCIDKEFQPADVIVLDDAFQHRALKPDLSVVLIDYSRPVMEDSLLPIGRLRDLKERVSAADIVIITKCPTYMDGLEKDRWVKSLGLDGFDPDTMTGTAGNGKKQTVLFSTIEYCQPEPVFPEGDAHYLYAKRAAVFSGIADDTPLTAFIAGTYRISSHLRFGDHHKYGKADIRAILGMAKKEPTAVIMTTEKDSQRLSGMKNIPETLRKRMFQVPIKAAFLTETDMAIFQSRLLGLL